jgi:hypothetical protein
MKYLLDRSNRYGKPFSSKAPDARPLQFHLPLLSFSSARNRSNYLLVSTLFPQFSEDLILLFLKPLQIAVVSSLPLAAPLLHSHFVTFSLHIHT